MLLIFVQLKEILSMFLLCYHQLKSYFCKMVFLVFIKMEPGVGFEPTTWCLQGNCSTEWANPAYLIFNQHYILFHYKIKVYYYNLFSY